MIGKKEGGRPAFSVIVRELWLGPGTVQERATESLLKGRYCSTHPLPYDVGQINLDLKLFLKRILDQFLHCVFTPYTQAGT